DDVHVALEHIVKLRQFVEPAGAQQPADRGDAGVPALRPHRAGLVFGVDAHRAELVHRERLAAGIPYTAIVHRVDDPAAALIGGRRPAAPIAAVPALDRG